MIKKTLLQDGELVRLYLTGNENSLKQLINRHRVKIYGYILKYVKNKQLTDDIFQDVFIKVIKILKSGKYKEEGKFGSWIIRVSHNLIIDFFRKQKRISKIETNDNFDAFNFIKTEEVDTEKEVMSNYICKNINVLIDLLPDNQKQVLKMRYFYDMSFKDIAEETDVSINTSLGRMRYALINLRKEIEQRNLSFNN